MLRSAARVGGVSGHRGRHWPTRLLLPFRRTHGREKHWLARKGDATRRISSWPPAPAFQQLLDALQIRSRVGPHGSAHGRERRTRRQRMVAWRWRGIARLARRANRQVPHLIDSAIIGDQVSRHELPAGSVQFMRKANVQQFDQTCVGVKADAILIRDGHQHEIDNFSRRVRP